MSLLFKEKEAEVMALFEILCNKRDLTSLEVGRLNVF